MLRIFYKYPLYILLLSIVVGCSSVPQKSSGRYSNLPDFSLNNSTGLADITNHAQQFIGTPYKFGGNTPKEGFDCSGFVRYVYKTVRNTTIPRTTQEQSKFGTSLKKDPPTPGDLVFFNTEGDPYSHVGIYMGNGKFIHAPSSGGKVRIEAIENPYWGPRYTEARRVIN